MREEPARKANGSLESGHCPRGRHLCTDQRSTFHESRRKTHATTSVYNRECFSKVISFIKKKAWLGRCPSSLGTLVPLRDWLGAGPHLTGSLPSLCHEPPALRGPFLQKDPHDSIRLPKWLKNLPANARDTGDAGSIPGSGRSPGEGNGHPLQYSCLENPTGRGAWRAQLSTPSTQRDYIRPPSLLWDNPLIPKSAG